MNLELSRTGVVLRPASGEPPALSITAVAGSPVARVTGTAVVLSFADEEAVVQTRFATSVLAPWRAWLRHRIEPLARLAGRRLDAALPVGLLSREQSCSSAGGQASAWRPRRPSSCGRRRLAWSEAHPAMQFRHGADQRDWAHDAGLVTGRTAPGLAEEIAATGAELEIAEHDPMVEFVRVHRAAIELAGSRGLDPNRPRRLSRSENRVNPLHAWDTTPKMPLASACGTARGRAAWSGSR